MHTIITRYMHTNSTLGVSAGSPHTSVSRMTVLRFSGLVLDTGNCSGLHIYTAEGIGCHKSSWQSLGRHIYAEVSHRTLISHDSQGANFSHKLLRSGQFPATSCMHLQRWRYDRRPTTAARIVLRNAALSRRPSRPNVVSTPTWKCPTSEKHNA